MALIVVPAGRCFRRDPSQKWVDPQPDKGTIELALEEGIVQFVWRHKESGRAEETLLIFQGEATFEPVTQDPSGRTHILKFNSSDQKYFFWFQRSATDRDSRACVDINALLQDPSYQPGTAPLPTPTPATVATSSTTGATPAAASSSSSAAPAPAAAESADSAPGEEAAQQDMARLLVEWASAGGLSSIQDDGVRLTDVLSPANMAALLASQPELTSSLVPLLPPGLNLPPNPPADILIPILSTPQFTDAIASLDSALRHGGLPGSMMRELGLPEHAGSSVQNFLQALVALSRSGEGDGGHEREGMDMD